MKYVHAMLAMLLVAPAYSESYSNVSTIKGLTVGDTAARVLLESMKEAERCSDQKFYQLEFSESTAMFATILAAKASGAKVSFQLTGCSSNRPKITHVYVCDHLFCGY